MPATTRATTGPSTTQATSRPIDPLATPESAVRALLQLSQQKQVPSLGKIISWIIEPPPDQELVPKLNQIRRPLIRGGSWEITESITHGSAAVVLYTIKPPPNKPVRTDHASDAAPESLWPLENGLRQPHPGALHRG